MKTLSAPIVLAALVTPATSFATEDFYDRLEREQRRMVVEMTMKLLTESKAMGIRLDRKVLPAFVVDENDADGDGVLNDQEYTNAEKRLRARASEN